MESEDIFLLKGPTTGSSYSTKLAEMRREGELCDVTIQAGSRSLQAHRAILAAASPVLRAMFSSGFAERTKSHITLECIDGQSLENLIDFIYLNELKITGTNVLPLLETSIYLDVDLIVNACFEFLTTRINPDNVLIIRHHALAANNTDVVENADRYVQLNFEDVSKSDDFNELSIDALKSFVCRDDLFVMTEEVVFNAVIRWVKASEEKRADFLPELLKYIRMPLLSSEFLKSRVFGERLIRESPVCKGMLSGIYKCQILPLVGELTALHEFKTSERFCKEKHNLKCSRMTGCGWYCLCEDENDSLHVTYYDSINNKWAFLYNSLDTDFSNVVCTEESLYFIRRSHISKLNLGTLELSDIVCDREFDSGISVAYHSNALYFFGGFDHSANIVQTFDLNNYSTEEIGNLILKRQFATAASLEKFIFVIGGAKPPHRRVKSVEKFCPETRQSTQVSPMLRRRIGCSCAPLNGKIYVSGGGSSKHHCISDSVEVYDPLVDQWIFLRKMGRIKFPVCLLPWNGKLHALGNTSDSPYSECEIYDSEKDEWKVQKHTFFDLGFCQVKMAVLTKSAVRYPCSDYRDKQRCAHFSRNLVKI